MMVDGVKSLQKQKHYSNISTARHKRVSYNYHVQVIMVIYLT